MVILNAEGPYSLGTLNLFCLHLSQVKCNNKSIKVGSYSDHSTQAVQKPLFQDAGKNKNKRWSKSEQ